MESGLTNPPALIGTGAAKGVTSQAFQPTSCSTPASPRSFWIVAVGSEKPLSPFACSIDAAAVLDFSGPAPSPSRALMQQVAAGFVDGSWRGGWSGAP